MIPSIIQFKKIIDHRGALSFCQEGEIPFKIRRVFYMYEVPCKTTRGEHSHVQCHQILISINGEIQVKVTSNTGKVSTFHLKNPNEGLLIPAGYWAEQYFLIENSICVVLASEIFDEKDYIRDKNKFLKTNHII